MTEINIILNTDFEEIDNQILKNDKELFYETLNNDFNIYKFNTANINYNNIPYNQIINDFLYNDNYLEYNNELNNTNSNIKKIILKKIFTFFNPIIKKLINPSNNVIDKNSVNLNFSIESKKNKIKKNQYFILNGLYNNKNYNNNLPYTLDEYKFLSELIIKLLKSSINITDNIDIFYKDKSINYKNHAIFDIEKIDIETLKQLYLLYIKYSNLYLNNDHLINNFTFNKNTDIFNILFSKSNIELVNKNYYENYIKIFNTFLKYKINNKFNNHSYFAFQSSNLLNLYEQILIYSIDNDSIKNQIANVIQENEITKKYYENQKIINEYNLKYIEIEYLTRKKFPNLFNLNSKEVIFHKYKQFNLDDLPKKYKEVILIEYKKLQTLKLQKIKNNCKHKQLINNLAINNNKYGIIKEIKSLIQEDNSKQYNTEYYKCLLCSQNLICPHVLEYYDLLFSNNNSKQENITEFSVRQRIINKYMTSAKVNMIYYCKVCGEELGKSLDLEQNIEYKDKVKLNTTEYTDNTLEIIKNNTISIIYSYITFTSLNINVSKKYLVNYVINSITSNINLIEKSLRKSKIYNEEQISNILNFNSIIFIYATLIYIMTKYSFLSFTSNKINNYKKGSRSITNISNYAGGRSIIVPKKIEVKSNKDLLNLIKTRFKEAFDLIISTNNILLYKLKYNNQNEKIKELLLKTYSIVAKNDQLTLSDQDNKIDNYKLLKYSSIFKYYSLIHSIESSYKNKLTSKYIGFYNHFDGLSEFIYKNNTNINNDYINNLLNVKNIGSNKIDNLFSNFTSSIIDTKLFDKKLDEIIINNYNDYKILCFNLFYYHIHFELYNKPIYDFITTDRKNKKNINKFQNDNTYLDNIINNDNNDNYNKYIKLTHILKLYEIDLINKNIKYNLYPSSFIKLNNSRYYYDKDILLNEYFCSIDGKHHKFNIYIYTDNNKNKVEFNKNSLDKNINDINKLKFIDYKCSKCLLSKSELKNNTNKNTNSIVKIINDNNDKDGFFNLYINVCPITKNNNTNEEYQYHKFNTTSSEKINDEIKCEICKIKYIDLLNKNINVYNQFNKEYIEYKNKKINNINSKLALLSDKNKNLKLINISNILDNNIKKINIIKNSSTNTDDLLKYINSLNFDTVLVNFSKLFNINIIYLQKLGITEGYQYSDIHLINDQYTDLRINKLVSYFRIILIYYNLLKYDNQSTNSDQQFKDIQNTIYEKINKSKLNKDLLDIKYNILNLLQLLKIKYENKDIVNFLIKLILQFIIDINNINKDKFDNNLNEFIEFIINKIIKYDELFTNYNYSQLKQMFSDDKISFDTEYENNINEDDDEDDLFAYNDLNIQFEDEDPLDE